LSFAATDFPLLYAVTEFAFPCRDKISLDVDREVCRLTYGTLPLPLTEEVCRDVDATEVFTCRLPQEVCPIAVPEFTLP